MMKKKKLSVAEENLEHLRGNLNWMSLQLSMFVAVMKLHLHMISSLSMDYPGFWPKNLAIQCKESTDEVVNR